MLSFAGKLLALVLIVQICTTQQSEQSPLLRCLTGYKDSNGKLSDCPPDRVFSKCASACPKTCQNPYVKSDNKECLRHCRSGCVCANGTLIDEGRNGDCVSQNECTCHHHGKIFMPNEVSLRKGKRCECKNGGWICNEQPISSRTCSVVGLTHVETFDGSLLTVKPSHYVLVKNTDSKTKHFQIEASVEKNFKRQLKFTSGVNTVVLSDIHSITLNNEKLEQLPFHTTDLTIRQATSQFILIESKDMHIAYDGNAVYVTLESIYREQVQGLCGSFDHNEDNDLRLPNGKLTCNTNIFSESYQVNDTQPSTGGEVPEKFDRPKAEKQCHRIKHNVCKSSAYVHGLLLSCIEDHRHVHNDDTNHASCYWHAIFAHACALTGNNLPPKYTKKWRSECEATFPRCAAGTVYEDCPESCLHSCSDREDGHKLNSVCKHQCIAGCICSKDHYHDTKNNIHEPVKCTEQSECSGRTTAHPGSTEHRSNGSVPTNKPSKSTHGTDQPISTSHSITTGTSGSSNPTIHTSGSTVLPEETSTIAVQPKTTAPSAAVSTSGPEATTPGATSGPEATTPGATSGSEVTTPGAAASTSGPKVTVPGATFGSEATTPGTAASTSGSEATTPGAHDSTSGAEASTPDAAASTSGPEETTPGATSGSEVTTPGAAASTSGPKVTTPGATSESEVTTPGAHDSTSGAEATTPHASAGSEVTTPGAHDSTSGAEATTPHASAASEVTTPDAESAPEATTLGATPGSEVTTPGAAASTAGAEATPPHASAASEVTTPGATSGSEATTPDAKPAPEATTPGATFGPEVTTPGAAASTPEAEATTSGATSAPEAKTPGAISESEVTTPGAHDSTSGPKQSTASIGQTTSDGDDTVPGEKCTHVQDIVPLGSTVLASVVINNKAVKPADIPSSLTVTKLPFVIRATFKTSATLHQVSVLNPAESEVSSIIVRTDETDDVSSTNPNAPSVTYESDIEFVKDVTITIAATKNNKLPLKPVKLSILACIEKPTVATKSVLETTSGNTRPSGESSTSVTSKPSENTTPQSPPAPSSTCKEELALIPEQINSENSPSTPRYYVNPRTPYNPTNVNPGETGVSFPSSDKAYIIIFPISSSAIIRSVRLPKTTNVDQIRVMFLDKEDKPLNAQPSDNGPLQITSKLENGPKINVNFPQKVNAVHVTLIHTTDNRPPQDVTVEILACMEPTKTTPETPVTTSKTRASPSTNQTSPSSSSSSPCKPKQNSPARVTFGECISQQEIQQESCAGFCPSYEELDPFSGAVSDKECLCCAPDATYTESILVDCRNATTGATEQRTSQIVRIRSCKCSMCLGSPSKSSANDQQSYESYDAANRSKAKTKTRRR